MTLFTVGLIDAGLNLGNLYASFADWRSAGDIFAAIAERAPDPNVGAQARWSAVESRFYRGDVAAALADARALIVNNPKAKQADDAIALVRALTALAAGQPLALTGDERLTRALALLRDSDPQNAFEELTALDEESVSAPLRPAVRLNRGIALSRLRPAAAGLRGAKERAGCSLPLYLRA